ncbi:Uncharacterised protein [Vibrio cholerae]|uniref:Uncharacterized protein n=1 Tax=Vibrio cholerae TaxID=666 RepID=A0A655Y4R1_VIBCL|nr:Uncharacterised protein [Vibrio cholerae]CSC28526.1 Uncharacterised protein [Vibrio cholerae]CSC52055.1 Uncharacterised protein [Vibrio cholerae]CSC70279.1 Uncharacterised protein [Vibrio cholerae]CSC87423.1 Uncharacterised protein [Vibrio cholerae]
MIKHIRKQQVIHMATVTRHVDNLMAILRQATHRCGVIDVQTLVDAVPQPT